MYRCKSADAHFAIGLEGGTDRPLFGMFWSSSSCCTALYCYARSALRWSISGFVGIRTGRGRMKLSSARCRANFSKEHICPTSGSRRTTRRGARDHSCIGSISESIRGHSMNWGACGGRPHGTPGDQAVRLIHPSTTCQSPKTHQDRERGDELTARVFAPGRSILSTMDAIL